MSNDRDYEALLNTLAGRVRGNFRDIKALVYVMLHDKEDLERCVMWMMNNFATIPEKLGIADDEALRRFISRVILLGNSVLSSAMLDDLRSANKDGGSSEAN